MTQIKYSNRVKPEETPNQLRAEVIEKAKKFSEIEQYRSQTDGKFVIKSTRDPFDWSVRKIQFVVNDKKRKVELLVFGQYGNVIDCHIAKCKSSDVFNEHIGKAIALGRALGLDVSEFEGAVQPTEVVEGQIYQYKFLGRDELHEITEVDDESVKFKRGSYRGTHKADRFTTNNAIDGEKIILNLVNDTNAIYKEVK